MVFTTDVFGDVPKIGVIQIKYLPSANPAKSACPQANPRSRVRFWAHAVVVLAQAGWRLSYRLTFRPNMTLVPLPTKCPEPNPQENTWQFMRDNWLSNRVFKSSEQIVDHCCDAWNKLVDQPWRIMSIGMRELACAS